jgi:tetratricopeptide (TPR) repeat protein
MAMRISPQSVLSAQAFYFVILPLVIIPVHELGHALAGSLVGMRITGITIGSGPTLLAGQLLSVKVRINLVPLMGVTMGFPKRPFRSLRWRRWIFTAGGPAANVLIYFALRRLFGPALHDFKHHPLVWTATWANWSLLALNLFPYRTKEGLTTDGHGLFTIPFWSKEQVAEEHARSAAARVGQSVIRGDLETADRLAEETRARHPESPWTLSILGSVEHAHQRHDAARDLFRQALAKTTDRRMVAILKNSIAFMNVMLAREEDLAEADRLSGEALAFLPDLPPVGGTRGAVLLRLGRVEEAWPLLLKSEAAAETRRNLAYTKAFVACALALRGKQDEARRKLAEAREADPRCDLLSRAEADIAAASTSPPIAAAHPVMDAANRAAGWRRWQRDARIVAFLSLVVMSNWLPSIPPALLVVLLALLLVPEISGVLALAACAGWTAVLFAFGFIRNNLTHPTSPGAIPVACAAAVAAVWLVVRHRRLGPPPPSRVPTALAWVLAGLGILFAVPMAIGLRLDGSAFSIAGEARDFVRPSLLLVALIPIVATRRAPAVRALAVLPGAVAILTLVGASDWYLNHIVLAATRSEGAPIVWSKPVPARVLRSRTIAVRGRGATLSPGGSAFFVTAGGWLGTGELTLADFENRHFSVTATTAAFLDEDRLLVLRNRENKKVPATLAEVRLSGGPTPVWSKALPELNVSATTIEIDRRTGHVYLLNNHPDDDQALVFRTTADGATPIEPIQAPHPGADRLLAHSFGPAGWTGIFVAKANHGAVDVWWRDGMRDNRLGTGVRRLNCPHLPLGNLVLWCLAPDLPILFKVDGILGAVTRVPGELPYDRSKTMLGSSRLVVHGRDEIGVIDLDTRRGVRLSLPETDSRADIELVRGGLATLADDRDQGSTISATNSKRHDRPRHPQFLARIRKRYGESSRELRDATEHAHWEFDHRVGIVDLQNRKVWMRPGYWTSVSWEPRGPLAPATAQVFRR